MRELIVTNDPVLLSFVEALLSGEGIESFIFDRNILIEGSMGVFPRRLVVPEQSLSEARRLLTDAGLGQWIRQDDGT